MLWGPITQTPLTYHLRYPDGNLTSLKDETLADHLQEEEGEGHHHVHQDPLQEEEAVVEVVAEVEEVVEEAAEGHSHYPGKHPPNLLKSS